MTLAVIEALNPNKPNQNQTSFVQAPSLWMHHIVCAMALAYSEAQMHLDAVGLYLCIAMTFLRAGYVVM